MPGLPTISRAQKYPHFVKTVTLDGTAGNGAVGTVAIASVTGRIIMTGGIVYCSASLEGATATIELGTANNTAGIVPQSTATDFDAGEFWRDTSPEAEWSGRMIFAIAADIILTIGTAAVTAGTLEFLFPWIPMSSDGYLR